MLRERRIGIIGAGAMAQALIHGLVEAGEVEPGRLRVANRGNAERLALVARRWGVIPSPLPELVEASDLLVLAVKPFDVGALLRGIGPAIPAGTLVISVAAGIPTSFLRGLLPAGVRVVRAMPNTSSAIRESATALAAGEGAGEEAIELAEAIFACVGRVVRVPEEALDVVTGLSGSGPAYVYLLLEKLIEAGREAGLPAETARLLAAQTVLGAARMVLETGEDPASLRRAVTSPNGTTMAALAVLEQHGFGQAIRLAVARAAERSRELAAEAAEGPRSAPPEARRQAL